MKKRKGISLIETLISLTIVGIALVALLPVMTLRKDGNDLSRGNRYWTETAEGSGIITPIQGYAVSVGNPEAPNINNSTVNFKVYNDGFNNRNIYPLRVTDGLLRWGGMTIDASTTGVLDIYAGIPSDTDPVTYPRRIYSDANKLVIENNSAVSNYSYNSEANPYDIKNSANYYYLANNDAEYLSVDVTNKIIGIGKNAVRYYSGDNFIGILNAPNTLAASCIGTANEGGGVSCTPNSLIIGAKTGATDFSQPSDFLIWRQGNTTTSDFKINAPVSVYGYKAGQILVSSDKRLKNIMGNYEKSINELIKIKPVEYNLKSDSSQKSYIGVVAQDLQKIFPEAVVVNKATGYLMVSQDPVFYAMLNSIKDLDAKNKQLKADNDKLEAKVAKLRAIRDSLKTSQGGANE